MRCTRYIPRIHGTPMWTAPVFQPGTTTPLTEHVGQPAGNHRVAGRIPPRTGVTCLSHHYTRWIIINYVRFVDNWAEGDWLLIFLSCYSDLDILIIKEISVPCSFCTLECLELFLENSFYTDRRKVLKILLRLIVKLMIKNEKLLQWNYWYCITMFGLTR